MEQDNTDKRNSHCLTKCFIATIVIVILLFFGYVCGQSIAFRNSESTICESFDKHLNKIDSMYIAHLSMSANALEDTLKLKKDIQYKIYTDSVLLARERYMSIENQRAFVKLHIEKVDIDYTVITIWGTVLSILFIVFSFFSIYKIEDSKLQMEELRKRTDEEAKFQLKEIKKEVETHKKNTISQATMIKELMNKYQTGYADFERKWDENLSNLQTRYQDAFNIITNLTKSMTDNQAKDDK